MPRTIDEIRYEGYGPGGVAVIVEALTDNHNRTAGEVRATFTKSGGNLADHRRGVVHVQSCRRGRIRRQGGERRCHAGRRDRGRRRRRDVERRRPQIFTTTETLRDVAKALEAKFGEPRKSALLWKPQNTVALDDEAGEKMLKLIESLDDNDDVQNVYANFEVSDALVQKMSA